MAQGSTTLVTGAAGFVGRHLVQHLLDAGAKVRATDRGALHAGHFARLGVEYVTADLTQPETLRPLFEGRVDRVFHLGAVCNFSTPYDRLYPINVAGVERITELALAHRVGRFVHVSSTSVYGRYLGTPFTEDSPRAPQDDYGRSKKAGEDRVFRAIQRGLPAVVCRPCTVYGPGCNDGAGKAFSRRTSIPAIPGSGRQRLANVRVEDVARALVHLAEIDGVVGQAFNVADRSQPTLGQALELSAKVFGGKPPRLHLPLGVLALLAKAQGAVARRRHTIPDLESDAVRYLYDDYVVDASKLEATGFELLYPDFEQSLEQMMPA
jgi:nucleoside-diphosphate-sugar epimerase